MKAGAGAEARALLLDAYQGVLSTHSVELPGYPFGSVAPYCLDAAGRPLFLISELAQHTRNLRVDPRCSLIVIAHGEDIQANARLTLVGDCRPLADEAEIAAAAARYYRYFPDSTDFHRVHDFRFFRLEPVRCRYIGGFGRIHWAEPEAVLLANPFAGEREAGIVAHMNADHADALLHYCRQRGLEPGAAPPGIEVQLGMEAQPGMKAQPVMTGIDAEGIHLRLGTRIVRISFPEPVTTPGAAREALVALARQGH